MKYFLPPSVMLTPCLVKYNDEEPEETSDALDTDEPQIEANDDSVNLRHKLNLNRR
ncbi:hypothetical protein [Vibrio sp.]|uniref:hypothetical protein n=1 Tax=Vibrio sp. TaxID=678 RepID=UPI003F6C434E